jgi:hypothetical protein
LYIDLPEALLVHGYFEPGILGDYPYLKWLQRGDGGKVG